MAKKFPKGFDEWCQSPPPQNLKPELNFTSLLHNDPVHREDRSGAPKRFFQSIDGDEHGGLVSVYVQANEAVKEYEYSFRDQLPDAPCSDHPEDIYQINFQVTRGRLCLSGATIKTVIVSSTDADVRLTNCFIGLLVLEGPSSPERHIILNNCWVGQIRLASQGVYSLQCENGGIGSMKSPAPDADNPISGTASFKNVLFPTSKNGSKMFQGAQTYRNMRAHMEKLNNGPMAGLFRTLELRSERKESDKGLTRALNALYDGASRYGSSIGRPWIWLLALYAVGVGYALVMDNGVAPLSPELYAGWRANLCDPEVGYIWRSFFQPLQSMISPAGLFGARNLVTANTMLGGAVFTVLGLVMDAMVFLSILAIRKRFKLP